jgi:hypothetical protein
MRSRATTGQWSLGNWPPRENVTISAESTETDPRARIQSMRTPLCRTASNPLDVLSPSPLRSQAVAYVSEKKPSVVRFM